MIVEEEKDKNNKSLQKEVRRKERSLSNGSDNAVTALGSSSDSTHEHRFTMSAHGKRPSIGGANNLSGTAGELADVVAKLVVGEGLVGGSNTGISGGRGRAESLGDLGDSLGGAGGALLVRVRALKERSALRALVALATSLADEVGAGLGEVNGFALDSNTLASLVDIGDEEFREAFETALGVLDVRGVFLGLGVLIGLSVWRFLGGLLNGLLVGRVIDPAVLVLVVILINVLIYTLGSGITVARAANGDHSTVHVHFAVTDFVEPSPGEERVPVRCVGGNIERVLLRNGTITLHRLDNLKSLALVISQSKLA